MIDIYEIQFRSICPSSNGRHHVSWDLYVPTHSKYETFNYLDALGDTQELALLFRNMQSAGVIVTPVFDGQWGDVGHYLFWPPGTTEFSDTTRTFCISAEKISIGDIRAAFNFATKQTPPLEQDRTTRTLPHTRVSEGPGINPNAMFTALTGIPISRVDDKKEKTPQCTTH